MAKKSKKIVPIISPRFPIATMAWYAQYSNPQMARQGTIEYAMSLTPGLTAEVTGPWVDELVRSTRAQTEDEKTAETADLLVSALPMSQRLG